jgi:hypothetical protein
MTVADLLRELQSLPLAATVAYYYDSAVRGDVDGIVVIDGEVVLFDKMDSEQVGKFNLKG